MRITVLYQYFGTPNGSWSTRFYELSKRWVAQGDEVTVITSPYDKSDIQSKGLISRQTIEGINIVIINSGDSNRYSFIKRVFRAILFALLSSYYCLRIKSDIIIASSGPISIGIPALISKFLARKKYIFEVRDLWPDGAVETGLIQNPFLVKFCYFFEQLCYKYSEHVVAASKGMSSSIMKRFPGISVSVMPNACDLELFNKTSNYTFPPYVNSDNRIFVYAGSLGLMDSVSDIIYGYDKIKNHHNIHIVIIGDGAERSYLENLTHGLNLSKNIHFIGLIPKNDVVQWFKIANATFVVFKRYQVWNTVSPNKMFDSFSAALPIIQNTSGWIAELVESNNCGLNVQAGDPTSMSDAILQLSNNDDLRNLMSDNAKVLANTIFSREQISSDYRALIYSIVSK